MERARRRASGGDDGSRPASSPTRRIWLCADDYGISPAVNGAIRDLIGRGRLNATTVMVVAPSLSSTEAASLAIVAEGRAAIGLHVTLTAPFRPCTAGFAPLRNGAFAPLSTMAAAALLRRLPRSVLAAEIAAQLDAFRRIFGRAPDFVDGHQHIHVFPQIREEAVAAVRQAAPAAWMRQCGRDGSTLQRISEPKALILDWLSAGMRRAAQARSLPVNPSFAGAYDFRPDADFAALFPRFLDQVGDGGLIMCHPGVVDDELQRLDPLTDLREAEYRYLGSGAFLAAFRTANVALK